jgi:hypothetical protein
MQFREGGGVDWSVSVGAVMFDVVVLLGDVGDV